MEHVIWVEKYRPQTVQACILPKTLKGIFQGIVDNKVVPNMILSGGPGMGKTTVARAMCEELGIDYIIHNASSIRGIDFVREDIPRYASSLPFQGGRKVLILDEADNLTVDAQAAFRACIEQYSHTCSFILTCNFKDKILPPIQSRCTVREFRVPKEEKKEIYKQLFERMCEILNLEKIKYDRKVIAELIARFFPDNRRLLNELQIFASNNGEINSGILTAFTEIDITKLYASLKEKDYNAVREWIVANADNDPARIYRKIYDSLRTHMKPSSIPKAVLLLADYQFKSGFSADQEICLLAFLTEIMVECEWA